MTSLGFGLVLRLGYDPKPDILSPKQVMQRLLGILTNIIWLDSRRAQYTKVVSVLGFVT